MLRATGIIICLGYIFGLLSTAIPGGGFWILLVGVVGAVLAKRRPISRRKPTEAIARSPAKQKKSSLANNTSQSIRAQSIKSQSIKPKSIIWLVGGLIGVSASFYLQFRLPQPLPNDISRFIPKTDNNFQEQVFIVRGEVISKPRLTRSGRGQFWLKPKQIDEVRQQNADESTKGVNGKLYVTVPILKATGLHPGERIAVTGILYQPRPASNPGGFDFQKYLQRQGSFAGLSGRQVNILEETQGWGWWKIRQKIVRSHLAGLGVPQGPMLSAMVLGNKAVDLPYDIRDLFVKAGLAHVIAASGFHTSLILGLVLNLTKRLSRGIQFSAGCIALIVFVSLTGFQASVLRAAIMGFAALLGIGLKRKVKQLGSLLVAATLLLLVNPLWIWDLGFQLSFLATLGLITTVPLITKGLNWLPPTIASFISVPIAATIWTLPLQLYIFGVVPAYSILLNIISTPLISAICIGGIISALVGLAAQNMGSSLAGFLYLPTDWLIKLVEFFSQLPGNSIALGKIAIWQLLTVYSIILLVCFLTWFRRRWWFGSLIALIVVLFPAWHNSNNLFQVTVMAAGTEPVVVIQNQGEVTLINSGSEQTARFAIIPFLKQQGVNQIFAAIANNFENDTESGWLTLLQNFSFKNFYQYSVAPEQKFSRKIIQEQLQAQKTISQPLLLGTPINTGTAVVNLINQRIPILEIQIQNQNWLLVGNLKRSDLFKIIENNYLTHPQVLWYSGDAWQKLIRVLKPKVAIISTPNSQQTKSLLSKIQKETQTQIFFTRSDGAIKWTPDNKFEAAIQQNENQTSVM